MNINDVEDALAQAFGRYTDRWQPPDPLDELIQTVLGQRTTKAHARRALAGLKGQCRTWSDVAATPFDILADQLRPAGLARHKAAAVLGILQRVVLESGSYSLTFLQEMPTSAITRFLRSLPGVGVHTTGLVLLFALGRPGVMPVESHVHRVARRLGWAPAESSPTAVQKAIEAATPDRLLLNLHVNLIRLGRRHCGLSRPDCPECPISDLCLGARLQPDGVPLPHAWQR